MKTLIRYSLILLLILGSKSAWSKTNAAALGTDATLKSIVLSTATTLVYSTGPADFNYTTSVDPTTNSLSVEPTTNDPAATVTVNGVTVSSGSSSGQITLNGIVTTTINLLVTAQDGVTTHSYAIVVYESGSNDAFLSALSISTGNTLVPVSTGPADYNYTTSVSNTTSSLTVTPTTVDPTATMKVNGVTVASGHASASVSLPTATTTIDVIVTAQDGVTKQDYQIIVSKNGSNTATLSNLSVSTGTALISTTGSSNFNYTTAVNSGVTSLTVTPTATDPTATITVKGIAVVSGHASGTITLNPGVGATTPINVVVTAQDGITTSSYTITVSANGSSVSSLSNLTTNTSSLLVGSGPAYTLSVSSSTTSITVTPTATNANEIITMGGVVIASGSASNPITLNSSGTTVISLAVKSQDATSTTNYSITVSKNGSNNNLLSSLALSTNSTLTTTSQTASVINYSTSVSVGTASLTVTPTTTDPTATITVNGTAVVSGSASGAIALAASPTITTITTVVTAQDGTTKTYIVKVSTSGSNNATMTATLSTGTALILSSPLNYTTSVTVGTSSLTVTPTATDPSSVITVNGVSVASGTASGAIALNPAQGATTSFVIKVVSQDGTVTNNYNIAVTENGSNIATLNSITLSSGTLGTPTYSGNTTSYAATVSPNTNSITVTPIATDATATININGLTVVSGAASTNIAINASGTTTINISVTAQDKVTTRSYVLTVSRTGATYTWTGTTLSSGIANWATAANWNTSTGAVSTKVPGAGDVATFGVYGTYTNQPVLTGATSVAELVFGSNTNLTLNLVTGTPNKLTITTALTVNAGVTASITADKITSPYLSYVDIASGAIMNIAGTLKLNTSYPVKFALKSTATGSATLGQITTGSITGSVDVERYIQGGSSVYRGYRLLSSAVYASSTGGNNVYSLNYVQATSFVTGTTGAAGGFDKTGNPSLYLFREDQASNNNSFTGGNYWGISNINSAPNYYLNGLGTIYNIPVGNGFFFFFRGDRVTNTGAKYSAGTVAESVTMTETGTLNVGPITVHDWYTPGIATVGYTTTAGNTSIRGYNLVGNPYASSIDWDTYNTDATIPNTGIYAQGGTVGNTIYIIDPVSKNYGVYMANSVFGGTNNATHIIPSGQGFFVQASASGGSLTFNESAKTTTQVTGSNLLLGTPIATGISQYLHLKLNKDSVQMDEIYINFNDHAQSNYVYGEDAPQKPGFGIVSLASMSSDGVPLSINNLKLAAQNQPIALNVGANTNGTYILNVPEIKSIPQLYDVWLMDAYKKDSVDLRQSPTYSFTINTSDAASYGSNRFSIVIRQNTNLTLRLLTFTAAKATNGAQVVWKTVNEQNYTNFTVERSIDNGKNFQDLGGFVSSAEGTYSFMDKNPQIADNLYRLKVVDVNGAISYSKVVSLQYSALSDNLATKTVNVYPNPTHGVVNLAINQIGSSSFASGYSALQTLSSTPGLNSDQTANTQSYDIRIFSITGNMVKSAKASQPTWQGNLSDLQPGTYIIQVLNTNDKSLVGKSTFVKL